MRKSGIISLVVVALCAGILVAERPAQALEGDIAMTVVGEPNDPNAAACPCGPNPDSQWDPATHLTAILESVASKSKLNNPVGQADVKVPERSVSVSARVDVFDVNGLIGFDYVATRTLALDEQGGTVYSKPFPKHYCHFYWPLRYHKTMSAGQWISQLQPYNLTVNLPLDPNRPYPLLLSKVEWSMYVLATTEVTRIYIPLRPSVDWLTVTPGLDIKVESFTPQDGKYDYRIAMKYSRSKVDWATGGAVALWTQDPTPEMILTKIDLLDASGKPIQDQASGGYSFSSGGGASGSGDLMTGTYGGSGSCDVCGTATTLCFTLALKPCQQELRFVLENVPVPSF